MKMLISSIFYCLGSLRASQRKSELANRHIEIRAHRRHHVTADVGLAALNSSDIVSAIPSNAAMILRKLFAVRRSVNALPKISFAF